MCVRYKSKKSPSHEHASSAVQREVEEIKRKRLQAEAELREKRNPEEDTLREVPTHMPEYDAEAVGELNMSALAMAAAFMSSEIPQSSEDSQGVNVS